jgi:predicted P-loop ATPase
MNDWLPRIQADPPKREAAAEISDKWEARLIKDKGGNRASILANFLIALRHAPEWAGVLGHDESAHRTIARRAPPWGGSRQPPYPWAEEDDIRAAEWAQLLGIMISPLTAAQGVQAEAVEHRFHPIREYLNGLQWDGDRRIDTWTKTYLGAPPSEYTTAVGARWLIGAVARVLRPGCKNDCALILEGPQGARKSTALRVFSEPWFTDDLSDIGSKDSQLQIRGVWIVEWAELDAMNRVDVARIKAFMSRSIDRFRPPYGHRLIELPRESVFAGTTNSDSYLRDETGARRFWPVRCGSIDIDGLKRDRDQLWAEAVCRYREDAPWWLDKALLVEAAEVEQAERYEGGVWDGIIPAWVAGRESVSIDEVLGGCIANPAERWTQADRNAVGRTLRAIKWERFNSGTRGARHWRFRPCTRSGLPDSDVNADVNTTSF